MGQYCESELSLKKKKLYRNYHNVNRFIAVTDQLKTNV